MNSTPWTLAPRRTRCFGSLDRHPFVAGEFVWTGWDYLGEPTPYYSRAVRILASLIWRASRRTGSISINRAGDRDLRFAHLLPHWTWPERAGQVTPVHVFTSGDEARIVSQRQIARAQKGRGHTNIACVGMTWCISRANSKSSAYKNGKAWATAETKTAGEPAKLNSNLIRSKFAPMGSTCRSSP
jgi:beta-galactosidase